MIPEGMIVSWYEKCISTYGHGFGDALGTMAPFGIAMNVCFVSFASFCGEKK